MEQKKKYRWHTNYVNGGFQHYLQSLNGVIGLDDIKKSVVSDDSPIPSETQKKVITVIDNGIKMGESFFQQGGVIEPLYGKTILGDFEEMEFSSKFQSYLEENSLAVTTYDYLKRNSSVRFDHLEKRPTFQKMVCISPRFKEYLFHNNRRFQGVLLPSSMILSMHDLLLDTRIGRIFEGLYKEQGIEKIVSPVLMAESLFIDIANRGLGVREELADTYFKKQTCFPKYPQIAILR